MYGLSTKRLVGLDLFRIVSASIILAFHSNIHFGCTYGMLNEFIKNGAVMMTGFFMMSGFALYYVYSDKNMNQISVVAQFYIKRLAGIIPSYYFTIIVYHAIFRGGGKNF